MHDQFFEDVEFVEEDYEDYEVIDLGDGDISINGIDFMGWPTYPDEG